MSLLAPERRSWADEAGEFRFETVYTAWGRGAEFRARLRTALENLMRTLEDAKAHYDEAAERVAGLLRRDALPRTVSVAAAVSDLEYLQVLTNFRRLTTEFGAELEKVLRRASQMLLVSGESARALTDYFAAVPGERELFRRFEGILKNPRRTADAERVWVACLPAAREYYVLAGTVLMITELDLRNIHRELLRFKIEFDKANPDAFALMRG